MEQIISVRTVLWCILIIALTKTISGKSTKMTKDAEIYLTQFGYLPQQLLRSPFSGELNASILTAAIMDFQGFAGINITGEFDDETKKLMALPRCGFRDKHIDIDSRAKRYAFEGGKWEHNNLTYRISKYPMKLNNPDVDKEIARAFEVWTKYTDLTFTANKELNPVDIEISFEDGVHGDENDTPFDGKGGTLAHAYFPIYGGDAHFDDAEYWTINIRQGTNLFQVAAHEFGHSLGLSHSDVRAALMAPFYRGFIPDFKLHSDDIQNIQALYGKKSKNIFIPNDDHELCKDPKIDAIFNTNDGSTYVFKGDHYYKLTENALVNGYPKHISDGWLGLPGTIDAAFRYKSGRTYFFKGTQYWRYTGRYLDRDYPKEISVGFAGIPDYLDTALVGGNGQIYFYKGRKFWRFDLLENPKVKSTYPKPIKNWVGVPNNIDAAFQHRNGWTYFFKGDKYYRFNDRTFSVDVVDPPFPRLTAHWWFGCKNISSSSSSN